MKPLYIFLILVIISLSKINDVHAQCGDSIRLAHDSLQWVVQGKGRNAIYDMVKYNDTMYVGGEFGYIGKYTGSCIGVDAASGAVLNQATWPKVNGYSNTVVSDGSGGIIIGGLFTRVGDSLRKGLARINSSGQVAALKADFNDRVNAVLVHNGIAYIGGHFTSVNGVTRRRLAAIDLSTGQLTPWSPNVDTGGVTQLATDGTNLYVGGESFTKINNINHRNLASFELSTGNLRNWTFNASVSVLALVVHGNTLYVGGGFLGINSIIRNHLAAIDLVSNTVTTWDPNPNGTITAIAAKNGTIYVAGGFSFVKFQLRPGLCAVDSVTGAPGSWAPDVSPRGVKTLAISGNTLYAGGVFRNIGGQQRTSLAAVNLATGNTANFSVNVPYDSVSNYVVHDVRSLHVSGNTVFAAGNFSSIGGEYRENIAGIDIKNNRIIDLDIHARYPSFGQDIAQVHAIKVHNGKLYIGGRFETIFDGVTSFARKRLASFDINGNYAVTAWNPLDTVTLSLQSVYLVRTLQVNGSYIYAGGHFSFNYGGTSHKSVFRADPATGIIDTWAPLIYPPQFPVQEEIQDMCFSGTKLYMGGLFGSPASPTAGNLMNYDFTNGATAYGSYDDMVESVGSGIGKVYAGGKFTSAGGNTRNSLAAIDTSAIDSLKPWNPDVRTSWQFGVRVGAITADRNRVYVGGYFDTVGGAVRQGFVVTDTATGTLWPWKPSFTSNDFTDVPAIREIMPMGDTVLVAGYFYDVDGKSLAGLARFHFDNYAMPAVSITASANPACAGSVVNFTAVSSMSSVDYQWKVNGVNVGTNSSTYSYTPLNNDIITCEIAVTGSGCFAPAKSSPVLMTVLQYQAPTISISGPAQAGVWATVNLNASVGNAGSNYSINWRKNGISFATTSSPSTSYTKAAGTDNITATITPAGCYDTATSNTLTIQEGVGIGNIETAMELVIYPNPVEGLLYIEGLTPGAIIILTDILGKEVYKDTSANSKFVVNTKSLSAGTYILQVTDSKGNRHVRHIVRR